LGDGKKWGVLLESIILYYYYNNYYLKPSIAIPTWNPPRRAVRMLQPRPTHLRTRVLYIVAMRAEKIEIPQALLPRIYTERRGPQVWPTSKPPVSNPKGAPEKFYYHTSTVVSGI